MEKRYLRKTLKPKNIDVLILCGGLGKRLRPKVSDRPKTMAQVNCAPFTDILLSYLRSFGFRRFILGIGYMSEKIKKYYSGKRGQGIVFSAEKTALGTGGAVKNAARLIKSNIFLTINGDCFFRADYREFLVFHTKRACPASLVVVRNKKNTEFGNIALDKRKQVIAFREKSGAKRNSLVSAGAYLFNREVFKLMPRRRRFSLEYDLFPILAGKGLCGWLSNATLIDIGTPAGLARAERYFKRYKAGR